MNIQYKYLIENNIDEPKYISFLRSTTVKVRSFNDANVYTGISK